MYEYVCNGEGQISRWAYGRLTFRHDHIDFHVSVEYQNDGNRIYKFGAQKALVCVGDAFWRASDIVFHMRRSIVRVHFCAVFN